MAPISRSERSIRIAHFSTYETMGGAAIAARRIHCNLNKSGLDSTLYVAQKTSADASVRGPFPGFRRFLIYFSRDIDKLPLKRYPGYTRDYFSPGWFSSVSALEINRLRADIVHLHWINHGYISINTIGKIKSPVVWTLHDSWAFTGGCHIPADCSRHTRRCGSCPKLGDKKEQDLTNFILQQKKRQWDRLAMTMVAPSRWMSECAGTSALFRNRAIRVIPHGVDPDRFKPMEKSAARKLLSLPDNANLVLFGAYKATNDYNKGFDLLCEALKHLKQRPSISDTEVLVFGTTGDDSDLSLPYKCRYLGYLDETALARLYSAADVMLVPSRQESFCQTAIEAMACGTPVVAFNATGPKDIIDHKINGYLATPYSVEDFAAGIEWVIGNAKKPLDIAANARKKIETHFSEKVVLNQYLDLYSEILLKNGRLSRTTA